MKTLQERRNEILEELQEAGVEPSLFSDLAFELNQLARKENNDYLIAAVKDYLNTIRDVDVERQRVYQDKLEKAITSIVEKIPEPVDLQPLADILNKVEDAIVKKKYDDSKVLKAIESLSLHKEVKELIQTIEKQGSKKEKEEITVTIDQGTLPKILEQLRAGLEKGVDTLKELTTLGKKEKPIHAVLVDKAGNYVDLEPKLVKDGKTQQWVVGTGNGSSYTYNAKGDKINPSTEETQKQLLEAIQAQGGTLAKQKYIDEVSSTLLYIGKSNPGTLPSQSLWQIRKVETIAGITTIKYPDGNAGELYKWDDRTTLTY